MRLQSQLFVLQYNNGCHEYKQLNSIVINLNAVICKGRTIRKVMGGGGEGNFRAEGIFFVIKFLVRIFLGYSMNIF